MKTFVLDTSTEKSFLAFTDGHETIFHPLPPGPLLSKHLGAELDLLLSQVGGPPDQIFVGQGPGSLTGVRVGLSFARALAFGWQIPCFEFCSLKAFAPKDDREPFAVLFDARSQGIHIFIKTPEKEILQTLLPEQAKLLLANIPSLFSPHPQLIEAKIHLPCVSTEPTLKTILI